MSWKPDINSLPRSKVECDIYCNNSELPEDCELVEDFKQRIVKSGWLISRKSKKANYIKIEKHCCPKCRGE